MASVSITGGTVFPEGTSVGAYPRSRWGVEGVTGAPSGSAVSTATVTSGVVAFTGLADGTDYVAYASSPDRYQKFSTPPLDIADSGAVDRQSLLNAGAALNEELVFNRAEGRTISASDQTPIAVAPFPCVIRAFEIVQESGGVAASDTDYWTVDLGRWRNGTFATIASKTTKTVPSNGEAITVLVPWTFDSITFNGTNAQLIKDDVVGVKYTKTAAASNIIRAVLTVRYEGL